MTQAQRTAPQPLQVPERIRNMALFLLAVGASVRSTK